MISKYEHDNEDSQGNIHYIPGKAIESNFYYRLE